MVNASPQMMIVGGQIRCVNELAAPEVDATIVLILRPVIASLAARVAPPMMGGATEHNIPGCGVPPARASNTWSLQADERFMTQDKRAAATALR
jgi:hypothetical protein